MLLLPLAAACGTRERPLNLLLISIDTLRADRLGCYGYERETSPELDRFARDHAVRFARAVVEAPWTLPSHVTLLSGLHPLRHGVSLPEHAPAREIEFLAQTLHAAGYYTFAFTGGGWISPDFGFDRGCDSFQGSELDCADNVRKVIDTIRHRSSRGPWFGFLHTYEVHCPYDPPEPYFSMFASEEAEPIEVAGRCGNPDFNALPLSVGQVRYLSDRYDGSIRSVDLALGSLFAFLEENGALEDTVVVITSDHGEEFGEHGRIGHERSLQREVLGVPLLVAAPGIAARTIPNRVGLADVAPTVLDLLGIPGPSHDGRSLVPLLRAGAPPGPDEPRISALAWKEDLLSILCDGDHLILDRSRDSSLLFDLEADPGERGEGPTQAETEVERLRAALERRAEELGRAAFVPEIVKMSSEPVGESTR